MQVVYRRCCGLDVHQKTVVAGVLLTESEGTVRKQVRTCGTMTADLLALHDWLNALQVEQVALASTGCSGVRYAPSWRASTRSCW
jgi:transposase